jgi:phosphohistidine phosphatase
LEIISEVEEDRSAVLLVGHNPGMEDLLRALTATGESMATGTLAKINLRLDEWSRVTEDSGDLECIVRPDELAAG